MSDHDPKNEAANAMWGGRFSAAPAEAMRRFNASIETDKRLAEEDIDGSRAHARMLAAQGIISAEDEGAILAGLEQISREIADGAFQWSEAFEDVHMNVEHRLSELIGPAAGRLHTARSRNDQVATDLRLAVRTRLDRLAAAISDWQRALLGLAADHVETVMPGFTHLQPATPVTFAHHLLAYVEMAERDKGRALDARRRLNECPLGAAALAGTSHPIDREATAAALGFERPCRNSLDAVSSRDFAMEAASAASFAAITLSRFAEEIVVFSTPQFGFMQCSERYATGSSIMPQKRNPDAAELIRGKTGGVLAAFQSLAVTMKGLPLAYSKDMQEGKAPALDALETVEDCLAIAAGMTAELMVFPERMAAAAGVGHTTAVDLADLLVRRAGLPFREAHHVVGRLVALADARGTSLSDLPLAEAQGVSASVDAEMLAALDPAASVRSRAHVGGPAPEVVRAEMDRWRTALGGA
ncbi:MAG: argininosuccinate lyase [Pseudomonadota bacterium]